MAYPVRASFLESDLRERVQAARKRPTVFPRLVAHLVSSSAGAGVLTAAVRLRLASQEIARPLLSSITILT